MTHSLVSICIPTYNGSQFIAEAMESAIAQTYPHLEIIVSDDASSDNTLKIIESYRSKTTIPIHVYHHEPQGIGANWNHCIKKANGFYIKFLFQDDVLMPNCVEAMIEVIEKDESFRMVASKRDFIVENTFKQEGYKKWVTLYENSQLGLDLNHFKGYACLDKSIFKQDAFFNSPRNKVGEPSNILFEKAIVEKIGLYREDLKQILDYEFCYRLLKTDRIPIIQEKLVKFRLHENQTTLKNKGKDLADYEIYDYLIYKEYFKYLSKKHKIYFLKKHNRIARFLFKVAKKLNI